MAELSEELARLRLRAGQPSFRDIARATRGQGDLNHSTVHNVLTKDRVPRWRTCRAVVLALGGDEQEFRQLWAEAVEKQEPSWSRLEVPEPEPAAPAEPEEQWIIDPLARVVAELRAMQRRGA